MTILHQVLLGLGLLALVAVPLAVLTFPLWESPLTHWLTRRQRDRTAPSRAPRLGLRGQR